MGVWEVWSLKRFNHPSFQFFKFSKYTNKVFLLGFNAFQTFWCGSHLGSNLGHILASPWGPMLVPFWTEFRLKLQIQVLDTFWDHSGGTKTIQSSIQKYVPKSIPNSVAKTMRKN